VTPQAASSVVADLPEDWFARAQRAMGDLQFKYERRQRELSVREQELELRTRELAARAEQLRDAFRKAEETSQELMARTHGLRDEEKQLTQERDAVYREREEIARSRQALDAQIADLGQREALLADLDRKLREREATVAEWEAEVRGLRDQQELALIAARDALVRERALAEGEDERTHVKRMLELEEAMETAAHHLHSREGEAERLLAAAAARAAEVHTLESRIREQEGRLEALRGEVVNAKRALLAVDDALTRMPYEVVDDFTKSDAFDAYEKAVRELRRFESGGA